MDLFLLRSLTICCTVAGDTPPLPSAWRDLKPTFLKSTQLLLWNDAAFALCTTNPATQVVVISCRKTSEGQRPCAEQQSRAPHQCHAAHSVFSPLLWFQGIFFFFFGSPNTVKIFSMLRIDSNHPLEEWAVQLIGVLKTTPQTYTFAEGGASGLSSSFLSYFQGGSTSSSVSFRTSGAQAPV